MLLKIPVEVLLEIVKVYSKAVATLAALRLTNKHLQTLATPFLFSSVQLDDNRISAGTLIRNLRLSRLSRYVKRVHIDACVDDFADFAGINSRERRGFFLDCSDQLQELSILASSLNSTFRMLSMVGAVLREVPLRRLNNLQIFAHSPISIAGLYGVSLAKLVEHSDESWNTALDIIYRLGSEKVMLLKSLQRLHVVFKSDQYWDIYRKSRALLSPALHLLTNGCHNLKSLRLDMDRVLFWGVFPSNGPLIEYNSASFDPSILITLHLNITSRVTDTSGVIKVLTPLTSLRHLTLKSIRCELDTMAFAQAGSDWSHVFQFCTQYMSSLCRYDFDSISTAGQCISPWPAIPIPLNQQGAEMVRQYKRLRKENKGFQSNNKHEWEALDTLRSAIQEKRRFAGLLAAW